MRRGSRVRHKTTGQIGILGYCGRSNNTAFVQFVDGDGGALCKTDLELIPEGLWWQEIEKVKGEIIPEHLKMIGIRKKKEQTNGS